MLISVAKAQEAADILNVSLAGLSEKTLRAAYHTKAKHCHPDHHGDSQLAVWARTSWANDCLGHWLKHNPPAPDRPEDLPKNKCRACAGTGRVAIRRASFNSALTLMCVMCNGLGERVEKEDEGD